MQSLAQHANLPLACCGRSWCQCLQEALRRDGGPYSKPDVLAEWVVQRDLGATPREAAGASRECYEAFLWFCACVGTLQAIASCMLKLLHGPCAGLREGLAAFPQNGSASGGAAGAPLGVTAGCGTARKRASLSQGLALDVLGPRPCPGGWALPWAQRLGGLGRALGAVPYGSLSWPSCRPPPFGRGMRSAAEGCAAGPHCAFAVRRAAGGSQCGGGLGLP
jgi:hypothetical protein